MYTANHQQQLRRGRASQTQQTFQDGRIQESPSRSADRNNELMVQAQHIAYYLNQGYTPQQAAQLFGQSGGTDRSPQHNAHIFGQSGGAGRTGDLATPQAARLIDNDRGINGINSMQPIEDELVGRVNQLEAAVSRLEAELQQQRKSSLNLDRSVELLFANKDKYKRGMDEVKNKIDQLMELYPIGDQDTVDPSALTFPLSGP